MSRSEEILGGIVHFDWSSVCQMRRNLSHQNPGVAWYLNMNDRVTCLPIHTIHTKHIHHIDHITPLHPNSLNVQMSSYLYTPSSSPPVVTPPDNENNNPHDISRRSSDDSTFGPYIPATSYDKRDKVIVVHIIMQIKPEWVEDVKFSESPDVNPENEDLFTDWIFFSLYLPVIKKIKRWAQAHEPGLLTFRATLSYVSDLSFCLTFLPTLNFFRVI
jgi:hypothetical protein